MSFISKNGFNLALAAIGIILFCSLAVAQSEAQGPFSCQNATAAKVNASLLLGDWFEAARTTYPGADDDKHNKAQCVAMNFVNQSSSVLVHVTYSLDSNKLWKNETVDYPLNISLTDALVDGIFQYNMSNGNTKLYKILKTDNTNYAFICGYVKEVVNSSTTASPSSTSSTTTPASTSSSTESSSSSSSSSTSTVSSTSESTSTQQPEIHVANSTEAYIFVRHRPNTTELENLMKNASAGFLGFNELSKVIQSDKCENGAATLLPMLTLLMAVALVIIKA